MTNLPDPTPRATGPRWRPWLATALALLVAGGGAAALMQRADKAKAQAEPAAVPLQFSAAELTRPLRLALPRQVEFSGPLAAPDTAIVRTKSAGTLLALNVAEGQRVQAGQVLGRMDLADLESRVDDRSASVQQAEAQLAEAERQQASNLRLAQQNFISEIALQSSQAKLDAARAQLRSARAQLSGVRVGVRDAALVAPLAGIVGKRHVVAGEKLSAEQPVVTVVNLARLELIGTVATHEVSLLTPGQAVRVTVEGWTAPVAGRIDRIAPSAEAGTRAIGVVVALDNRDERLRAGQYAQALVTLDDPTPRLTVPLAAVGQASGQDQVWSIEGGRLVRRIVITGRRDAASGRVEVLSGLPEDAQVLAARFDNLKEGAAAVLAPVPAAGAGPGRRGGGRGGAGACDGPAARPVRRHGFRRRGPAGPARQPAAQRLPEARPGPARGDRRLRLRSRHRAARRRPAGTPGLTRRPASHQRPADRPSAW